MTIRGEHTYSEIMSQPVVWKAAINSFQQQAAEVEALWQRHNFNPILFTGCGSTYYLSQLAATLFQRYIQQPAKAYPGSELALMSDLAFTPNTNPLLITVSRSGETSETVEAVRVFRAKTGNPVVTITCYPDSTLAKESDVIIAIPDAQEKSVAQTRSFSSMTLVLEALVGRLAGLQQDNMLNTLALTVERLLATYGALAQKLGEDQKIERFFFLGSGTLYAIACEAMLKMKEMSLSYSEAYHVLEFRHGPMSMVNEQTLVVGLISETTATHEAAVLRQMREQGAQILALAEADYGLDFANWSHFVQLQSGLPHHLRPVVYLPVLQLMAYHRAMIRGLNPDAPTNLTAFISLDNLSS
jgi:glucosamine--fructose-6-phosphate aminotransferase (isomerizing)